MVFRSVILTAVAKTADGVVENLPAGAYDFYDGWVAEVATLILALVLNAHI